MVLQTIGPTKSFLQAAWPQLQANKAPWCFAGSVDVQVMLSFVGGSLTGSFAEVMTNPPDQAAN